MKNRSARFLFLTLVATIAIAACRQKEEAAIAPPPATEPVPTSQAAVATATVIGVDLGNAVGANKKVVTPMTTFAPQDTIIAAIATRTSNPTAAVRSKLGARWTQLANKEVVNEESQDATLTGDGVTNFRIAKPEGWQPGKYKLEVSLDNAVVQTREYEVK
ncbi:MAG TPA: hypothetical protein VGQ93_08015 [Lysobacter sp.]|jgi:hypothetical protein|nr:hypothetical protein [Lysobacter sp.]